LALFLGGVLMGPSLLAMDKKTGRDPKDQPGGAGPSGETSARALLRKAAWGGGVQKTLVTKEGYGKLYETDLFVVVTARYYNEEEGDYDHVVITAYPVSSSW
jgi:hypothetical protein